MLTRRQLIAAGSSALVFGCHFDGIFVLDCYAQETPYRRPLSDIPLSEMTDEQLVRWASSGIAGGFLGGIGNVAFNKLMEELNGRPRSLEDILADQTRQLAAIIGQKIEENEIKKLRAKCIAVQRTMQEYKNAPTDAKLENVDTYSQDLLALTEAFGPGLPRWSGVNKRHRLGRGSSAQGLVDTSWAGGSPAGLTEVAATSAFAA